MIERYFTIVMALLLTLLLTIGDVELFAQQKKADEKGKKEKVENRGQAKVKSDSLKKALAVENEIDASCSKAEKADKEKDDNDPAGNAYGQDKGELSGKEFGQQRAETAKTNRDVKKRELDESVAKGEQKVAEAKEKIKAAKDKLEKEKKGKKINDAQYAERKAKIDKAEQKANELDDKIKKSKEKSHQVIE